MNNRDVLKLFIKYNKNKYFNLYRMAYFVAK